MLHTLFSVLAQPKAVAIFSSLTNPQAAGSGLPPVILPPAPKLQPLAADTFTLTSTEQAAFSEISRFGRGHFSKADKVKGKRKRAKLRKKHDEKVAINAHRRKGNTAAQKLNRTGVKVGGFNEHAPVVATGKRMYAPDDSIHGVSASIYSRLFPEEGIAIRSA